MPKLSHWTLCLSMALWAGAAAAAPSIYTGRWTVADDKPTFSSKGLFYKTIDVAPCGRDYCGVSVGKNGACGPTLFRFLAKTVARNEGLNGHGRWGSATKNVEIWASSDKDSPGGKFMSLNLGDGHNFGDRGGNMPMFSAGYKPAGAARCTTR